MNGEHLPTSSPELAVKGLTAFDHVSGWTCGALAIVSAFLLFSPYTLGIDLTPIRQNYGGWIFTVMAILGALTAAKMLRHANHFFKSFGCKPQNFIVTQRTMGCWWNTTKQSDESYMTQLVADCDVLNLATLPIQFHAIRLISPKASKGDVIHTSLGLFRENQTGNAHIYPNKTDWVRLSVSVRQKLGVGNKALKVIFGVTDNLGKEQRVKLKLRHL